MKKFKTTQSSSNSKSFIVGTVLMAIFLTAVFFLQKHTILPELITQKQFIIGGVLCIGGVIVEIIVMRSNRKAYEKKVAEEIEHPHRIPDFLLPKA